MAINGFVQYTTTSGFLPDILLFFTQAPIIHVWFDGAIIEIMTIILTILCTTVFMFCYDWWLCMVINISVQNNSGFLSDIILSTQGYYD